MLLSDVPLTAPLFTVARVIAGARRPAAGASTTTSAESVATLKLPRARLFLSNGVTSPTLFLKGYDEPQCLSKYLVVSPCVTSPRGYPTGVSIW